MATDDLTPERGREIDDFLFAGQKIQAIKVYREGTNVGLAEAKAAVEAREAQLRQQMPMKFRGPARSGCLGGVLMLLAAGGLVAAVVLM